MGIPKLGSAIGRYGKITSLSGDSVVIDGPSMIYQIYEACISRNTASSGFICQPSYKTLGRLAIGWLDELRRHNVTVRKIYFDGYLPPNKWQVRRERLQRECRKMGQLFSSYPHGSSITPPDDFDRIKSDINSTRVYGYDAVTRLPKPPFLIPGVIDVLRSCDTWGPLIQVVSGEADMFCAEYIRQHGGTILSGDSDLFITDLGPNGNVSFFSDVFLRDQEDESKGVGARKFSLYHTNNHLGVTDIGGLTYVAYNMLKDPRLEFQKALQQSKKHPKDSLEKPGFKAFLEELSKTDYLPANHPVLNILSGLDPRISEIVIQTLLLEGDGALANAERTKESRGPETLAMFLPVMIERRDKKSTWTMSTRVRQLAYTIVQELALQSSQPVIEYRVLITSKSPLGRQVGVFDRGNTLEQCGSLVDTLKQIAERVPREDMRWLAFAIYQNIVSSRIEEQRPLSASLISKANNPTNEHSWDLIHFTAQVQASLYSLRMLKQVLYVLETLRQTQSPEMTKLREQLAQVPDIPEWPTVDSMPQTLVTAGKENLLSTVADILGIPVAELEIPETETISKSKRRKIAREQARIEKQKKVPSNLFSILGDAS